MAERGFAVEPVFCGTCGESAEGLPDGRTAKGLPEGWVSVQVSTYRPSSTGTITSAYDHLTTQYYCSKAHLPSELPPAPHTREDDS